MDSDVSLTDLTREDITEELLAEVFAKLWTFSTSLFAASDGDEKLPTYCGTGTFVATNESCLLTAAHVWEALQKFDLFALSLKSDRAPTLVRLEFISPVFVSERRSEEWGPDLALLRLPDVHASEIAQYKAFYNLDRRASEAAEPEKHEDGLRIVIGAVGEKGTVDAQNAVMPTDVFPLQILRTAERDGFDYLDICSNHGSRPGLPNSYGGISGSGLWRIALKRSLTNGEVSLHHASLEGVAFHEGFDESPQRGYIRCHGRKSVYVHVLGGPTSS